MGYLEEGYLHSSKQNIKRNDVKRQVTLLNCDVVNSVSRANEIDPEDMSDEIDIYHNISHEVVKYYGGKILDSVGDSVMAVFGSDSASEHDARDALNAAISLVRHINDRHPSYSIRVGVVTGNALISEKENLSGHHTLSLYGELPSFCARVRSTSTPNVIHVDANTHSIVIHDFSFRALGFSNIKGFKSKQEIFAVEGKAGHIEQAGLSRFGHKETVFCGREEELKAVQGIFSEMRKGSPGFLHVYGSEGIGKYRLVNVGLANTFIDKSEVINVKIDCTQQYSRISLEAVIRELDTLVFSGTYPDKASRSDVIERFIEKINLEDHPDMPCLYQILDSYKRDEDFIISSLSDAIPKERYMSLMRAICAIFGKLAREKCVVIFFKSLQHANNEMVEFIHLLSSFMYKEKDKCSMSLVITTTMKYLPGDFDHKPEKIHLASLSYKDSEKMVDKIVGKTFISPEYKQKIIQSSSRVPLFLEEITWYWKLKAKELRQEGEVVEVPMTLKGLLYEKIESLEVGSKLVWLVSCFYTPFTLDNLTKIASDNNIDNVSVEVNKLAIRGILGVYRERNKTVYMVRDFLLKTVIYETIPKEIRINYHRTISKHYKKLKTDRVWDAPEILALNLSGAEEHKEAAKCWLQAVSESGKSVISVYKKMEYASAGINACEKASDDKEIDGTYLKLLLVLAESMAEKNGPAYNRLEKTLLKALEIATSMNDYGGRCEALYSLVYHYICKGQLNKIQGIVEQLSSDQGFEKDVKQSYSKIMSYLYGLISMGKGDFIEAETHYKKARKMLLNSNDYEFFDSRYENVLYTSYIYAYSRCSSPINLLILGEKQQAQKEMNTALESCVLFNNPHVLCQTMMHATAFSQLGGEDKLFFQRTCDLMQLGERYGFNVIVNVAQLFKTYQEVVYGKKHSLLKSLKSNVKNDFKYHGFLHHGYTHYLLAKAYFEAQEFNLVNDYIDEVMISLPKNIKLWIRPKLLLLKAESAIMHDGLLSKSDILSCYEEALLLSERSGALLFLQEIKGSMLKNKILFKE